MGFFDKIKAGLEKTRRQMGGVFAEFTGENEEFYDELEEALIVADSGADTAFRAVAALREKVREEGLRGRTEINAALVEILTELLSVGSFELKLETKPSVILMVGVNGVGKTTTIGKLAAKYTAEGKKVLLAAGDTFRAAAAEQLTVWAERSGAEIVKHGEGSDPGAVVFDALTAAKARGTDIVIIDTAGRLHNKANLMNELAKIRRIITRELPEADVETLAVLDAVTGQNGLIQIKQFAETAELTGIVITKLDGTARGGIVFAIAKELGLPVKFIGVGEKLDAIEIFHPDRMASRILGMGDVLSLIEKAQATIDEEKAKELEQKIRKNRFTLQDFYDQIQATKKMGSMGDILGKLPGLSGKLDESQLDDNMFAKTEAIILSMTKKEREDASLKESSIGFKAELKDRFDGDENLLCKAQIEDLKQFGMMQTLTKQMSRGKMPRGLKGLLGGGGGLDMNSLGDMGRGGFGMGAHSAGRQRKSNKRKKKKR